ncbi:hypothetical protein [Paenibacillus amylolyticus]|uniref:hypothetical protein n=1 Tax=Paenibacillus amylolyticus TaxID=1451 RepID=UPI00201D7901|nr:hypothetical protein [Paenibacillus amylolyticus]MCL6660081.1 hypothetical protein [Paenibacillus amylolyticus]
MKKEIMLLKPLETGGDFCYASEKRINCWKDEFDWEQIYFSLGNEVFILDLYQWG